MRVGKPPKAFAYRIYRHFTQQCTVLIIHTVLDCVANFLVRHNDHVRIFVELLLDNMTKMTLPYAKP